MTITIDLSAEAEARLSELAKSKGMDISHFIQSLLEERVSPGAALSPGERAALWRSSIVGLPVRPPLSDAAISRETLYDTSG